MEILKVISVYYSFILLLLTNNYLFFIEDTLKQQGRGMLQDLLNKYAPNEKIPNDMKWSISAMNILIRIIGHEIIVPGNHLYIYIYIILYYIILYIYIIYKINIDLIDIYFT